MTRLMLVAAVAAVIAAGCQADNRNLERKIDEMAKDIKEIKAQRGAAGAAAPRPTRVEPDRQKTYSMPIEGDPVDGPADAKVTLVKAYDYACPYCEKVRDTMDELRKKYGNDLRIVFKQFVVHPQIATAGALAVCAANKQGKFLQMDQLLWDKGFKGRQFDKDKCWESADGCPIVGGFAAELQLDNTKLLQDMKACTNVVQKDMADLHALSVGGTPAFFVNGRFLTGAMPIDGFSAVIDEELKKANDRIAAGASQATYYQQWVLDKGERR